MERKYLKAAYTIGCLWIEGTRFCDTLEDRVRDLKQEPKVPGATAIPAGRYEVIVNRSPRFGRDLPRLLDVPGFEGILIHRGNTAKELHGIFGSYLPDATERDFYDMEIGSASIMRGYMAHPCDEELTLEKKLRLFLTMSLRAYNVPKEEVEQVIRFVEGLDIRAIAEQVMQKLFKALAMRYEFSLTGIVPEQ